MLTYKEEIHNVRKLPRKCSSQTLSRLYYLFVRTTGIVRLWIALLIWTLNPIWQRKLFNLTTHLPCFTSGKLSSLPSGTHSPLSAKSLPSASPPWQCSEQESRGAIVIKLIRKKRDKIILFPPRLDCCLCVKAEDWWCWAWSHFGGISPNVLPLEEATGGYPSG